MEAKPENYNILYVDDEDGNLRIFETSFKRSHNVTLARSPFQAMEYLEEKEFHLVIADQKMPKMTGSEFLTEVAKKYPHTVRMILTGFSDIGAVIDAVNMGKIYKYVPKPWNKPDMTAIIKDCLEEYQRRADQRNLITELQKELAEKNELIEQLRSKIQSQVD